jgi:hypothetical protein
MEMLLDRDHGRGLRRVLKVEYILWNCGRLEGRIYHDNTMRCKGRCDIKIRWEKKAEHTHAQSHKFCSFMSS